MSYHSGHRIDLHHIQRPGLAWSPNRRSHRACARRQSGFTWCRFGSVYNFGRFGQVRACLIDRSADSPPAAEVPDSELTDRLDDVLYASGATVAMPSRTAARELVMLTTSV